MVFGMPTGVCGGIAHAGRHGVSLWEQPLQFSKTYYVDGNSAKSNDNGPGTSEQPFRTIGKAAQVLQPGERVVIACRRLPRMHPSGPGRHGSGSDDQL